MTEATRKILEEALALSDEQRAVLVEALNDSLNMPAVELGPEWSAEINHRIAQVERGEVRTVPWEEAEAHFQKTLLGHSTETKRSVSLPGRVQSPPTR